MVSENPKLSLFQSTECHLFIQNVHLMHKVRIKYLFFLYKKKPTSWGPAKKNSLGFDVMCLIKSNGFLNCKSEARIDILSKFGEKSMY